MSSTGDILAAESVAQDLDDSLRTNETGLLHLEDQIDRLTDAIISASADPTIELEDQYDEDRACLLFDIDKKSRILDDTLEELRESEDLHQKEVNLIQKRNRLEKDSLVEQLRQSQAELMEYYSKVDEVESEKERLEWELNEAEDKFRVDNEELIDQNNALMNALQEEQNKSRDVIEDLERSLQRIPLPVDEEEFEKNMENLSSEEFEPHSGSSPRRPVQDNDSRSALEVLKNLKNKVKDFETRNEEFTEIIDDLEQSIIKESVQSKRYYRKCADLNAELEEVKSTRPTIRQLEDVKSDLKENRKLFEDSQKKVQELERVLVITLSKHDNLVGDLNKTIDSQDIHIEELKKKNFYPKIMDDLKKENSILRGEVTKLNELVKESPNRKVLGLKNKFEESKLTYGQLDEASQLIGEIQNTSLEKIESIELLHREEVNHFKGKLMILEKKLTQSLEENAQLNQELNDAIQQLDENSFNYENVIQDLQTKLDSSSADDLSGKKDESFEDLKKELDNERKRRKSLSKILEELNNQQGLPPPPSVDESVPIELIPPPEALTTSPKNGIRKKPPVMPKPNSAKVLTEKLKNVTIKNEENKIALVESNEKVYLLENKVCELEEVIKAQNGDIQKLKVSVERGISVSVTPVCHTAVEELERELEETTEDKLHLEETLAILTEEHEAQVNLLSARIADLDKELENALFAVEPENLSIVSQLENEKEARHDLEKKVETLEFQLREAFTNTTEDSLDNLQQNLDAAEKMCEQLMSDEELIPVSNSELKRHLKEKDEEIETLKQETKDLKEELDNLHNDFADISTEIAEADSQYGQRIENLQKQIKMNQSDHDTIAADLRNEIEMLRENLQESEKQANAIEGLEKENKSLSDECKFLTDRLASDILSKKSPVDDKSDLFVEMKEHYEKIHNRLRTEIDLKKEKVEDLQEDLKRAHANFSRKISSMRDGQDITEERHRLQIEEHCLTIESKKRELEQVKKLNKRFESNIDSRNIEFNEVVTKLLNLESLIEIQQDNLLAKDEEIDKFNRQLKNVKAELEVSEQRHDILKEESVALDILENSLNEVSLHEQQQDAEISDLKVKLGKAVSDKNNAEKDKRRLSVQLNDSKRECEALKEVLAPSSDDNEETMDGLREKVFCLEKELKIKEHTIKHKTNEINTVLSQQDKTKQELVTKNIELHNRNNDLMESYYELETENSCLLEDIDVNFTVNTESIKELEGKIKELKCALAEKDENILNHEDALNKAEAKNVSENQTFFETRKQLETEVSTLKNTIMDLEGCDAVKSSSSVHSVWLEDTASLNHVISEKDRQIRDLRDTLIANSPKGSTNDLSIGCHSLGSIAPPSDIGIQTPDGGLALNDYRKQINSMHILITKKDDEYANLYQKFREELERHNADSNIYNTHIQKLQEMVSLFEKQADEVAAENKMIIQRSAKGINDVNDSLNNLNEELALESQRTTEVLSELDILKEEIEATQQNLSDHHHHGDESSRISNTLDKVFEIEDTFQMTIEEHQCSLDHYQLLFQTTQQEMQMIADDLKNAHLDEKLDVESDHLSKILGILQEKVTLLGDKLYETKNEVTFSSFRGSQSGNTAKETAIIIEQAELKCTKFENEIDSIRSMLGKSGMVPTSERFIKVSEELQEILSEMGDLKDLLALRPQSHVISKADDLTAGMECKDYTRSFKEGASILEQPVSLHEIDGLELITHDLRYQLRQRATECETLKEECEMLRQENESMDGGLKKLQRVFGHMLSEKEEKLDCLNDSMSAERSFMESKFSQLSEVIDIKDKSQDHLKESLSFEQGRVQQLKEDLDSTYDKTFEHIKEYEGRVSTITERLNVQQQQVKAKLESCESEVSGLNEQLKHYQGILKDKDSTIESLQRSHKTELNSKETILKQTHEASAQYQKELEELKSLYSISHGSLDMQLAQYGDIMTKFRNEISQEKEAFQNSLQKLNYLVEDRTQKIREYERIVADLQQSLSSTQTELQEKEALYENLVKEKSKLNISMANKSSNSPIDNENSNHWKNRANRSEQQMRKLEQTLEEIKYSYETQLTNKADEILTTNMKLEKLESDLSSRTSKYNAMMIEVKALKLEIEASGSDNQLKDLEQKLAAKQCEVEDAVFRMQRHQRETEALKDVLSSYQNNADNDVAQKISEYETTIADYEVQVTMLKKNISDLHTQLHNTCDERQKVIDKAQGQIATYQRRLDQMNDRVEEGKAAAAKEAESFKEAKRHYQRQVGLLENQLRNSQNEDDLAALRHKIRQLERQQDQGSNPPERDMQQRFELAVKRADHLQEQVDTMRKTNKRIQKTVEELWAENTELLKDLSKNEGGGKDRARYAKTHRQKNQDLQTLGTSDI